jgi:hypothetical protein
MVERALPRCMWPRQHSLFDATEPSASLASVLPSLRATGLHASVNAWESLGAGQEHRREVLRAPAAWLPWNSQAHLVPPEPPWRPSSAIWA